MPCSCFGDEDAEDDDDEEEESDDVDEDDDDEDDDDGEEQIGGPEGGSGAVAVADAFPLRVVLVWAVVFCEGVTGQLAWDAASPSDLDRFCDRALWFLAEVGATVE